MIFAWTNFVILMAISGIHIFWAFGGKWGASAAVPELDGFKVLRPGPFSSIFVATATGVMAAFHLYRVGILSSFLPGWVSVSGIWIISGIFLLRAIGEFRYVGFFKRVKGSSFAGLDTRYYSPLCLLISINAFLTGISDI